MPQTSHPGLATLPVDRARVRIKCHKVHVAKTENSDQHALVAHDWLRKGEGLRQRPGPQLLQWRHTIAQRIRRVIELLMHHPPVARRMEIRDGREGGFGRIVGLVGGTKFRR